MVEMEKIQDFCDRIAREFRPEKIILFGSHARGDAGKYSDVDLLVIMPFEGHSARKAAEIRIRLKPSFPLDLLLRTPETVERRLSLGDFFLQDITEEGRVLYERPHTSGLTRPRAISTAPRASCGRGRTRTTTTPASTHSSAPRST